MNGKVTSGVDTIIRIKRGADWKDAVSRSYDVWLEQLDHVAGQIETIFAETEGVVHEIRSLPVAEQEEEYDRLARLFAEVGF